MSILHKRRLTMTVVQRDLKCIMWNSGQCRYCTRRDWQWPWFTVTRHHSSPIRNRDTLRPSPIFTRPTSYIVWFIIVGESGLCLSTRTINSQCLNLGSIDRFSLGECFPIWDCCREASIYCRPSVWLCSLISQTQPGQCFLYLLLLKPGFFPRYMPSWAEINFL